MKATVASVFSLLVAGCAAQGYGGQGNSYDQELRRRQVEYAQQQALRQQQAQQQAQRSNQGQGQGYTQQQQQQAAYAQQQQQAAYQQKLRQQQAQQQQMQQQQLQQQLLQQQMREQAMRAQAQAGGSGKFEYGSSGGGKAAMTSKQKKELQKRQAEQKKMMAQKAKDQKSAAANRMKAWEQAKRKASKGKGSVRPKRTSDGNGGVVGFVFSVKGARTRPRAQLHAARVPTHTCVKQQHKSCPRIVSDGKQRERAHRIAYRLLVAHLRPPPNARRRGAPRRCGLPLYWPARDAHEGAPGSHPRCLPGHSQGMGNLPQANPPQAHLAQGRRCGGGRGRSGRRAAGRLVLMRDGRRAWRRGGR